MRGRKIVFWTLDPNAKHTSSATKRQTAADYDTGSPQPHWRNNTRTIEEASTFSGPDILLRLCGRGLSYGIGTISTCKLLLEDEPPSVDLLIDLWAKLYYGKYEHATSPYPRLLSGAITRIPLCDDNSVYRWPNSVPGVLPRIAPHLQLHKERRKNVPVKSFDIMSDANLAHFFCLPGEEDKSYSFFRVIVHRDLLHSITSPEVPNSPLLEPRHHDDVSQIDRPHPSRFLGARTRDEYWVSAQPFLRERGFTGTKEVGVKRGRAQGADSDYEDSTGNSLARKITGKRKRTVPAADAPEVEYDVPKLVELPTKDRVSTAKDFKAAERTWNYQHAVDDRDITTGNVFRGRVNTSFPSIQSPLPPRLRNVAGPPGPNS